MMTGANKAASTQRRIVSRSTDSTIRRVALVFGALALGQAVNSDKLRALPQVHRPATATFAKAPVPRLSISPEGLVADINGNSTQDLTLHYRIDGDLTQVNKAWVEISDGPHGKVVFTQPVPIQVRGEVIWPHGQPMHPTPNTISFQVRNPGGEVSGSVQADAEIPLPRTDPTPVLSAITPRRVVKGSKHTTIALRGRNFVSNAMVTFSRDGVNIDARIRPRFIGSHRLLVVMPDSMTSQVQDWQVEVVENDFSNSDHLPLLIVPAGLPPMPTLYSISPSALPARDSPADRWITLTGSNFRKGDTRVLTDDIPDELDSRFVSENQMRALIPAWRLSGSLRLNIHVESASDADLASKPLPFSVFDKKMDTPSWVQPFLDSVNDGYVTMPESREARPVTVKLLGSNFRPHSTVIATVEGEDCALSTAFVSPHELRALVPTDLWSQNSFIVTFHIDAKLTRAGAHGKTLTAEVSLR